MIGYMDAILQRQDKGDMLLKMESFQIEQASRRSLSEIMDHFKTVQAEHILKTNNLQAEVKAQKKNFDNT